MIDIVSIIVKRYPSVKENLRIAHVDKSPEEFIKQGLMLSLYITIGSFALIFFFFSRSTELGKLLIIFLIASFVVPFISFNFLMQSPKAKIRQRQREMDKEVLFAGRFLLVKLESGEPLFNSLLAASKSYGVAGKYFKEIADDISTGTPIEKALENARAQTPSERFKRILWQIISTLKTGTEIGEGLKRTLHTITRMQMIEIKEYGKKLNSLMLFYMVTAVVIPSLGVTFFLIMSSFLQLQITGAILFFIVFILGMFQFTFIAMIKTIRPMVDV